MITQDKKSTARKSYYVRTMMGNPRLRQVVLDSLEAPLGSTKREKLRVLMTSFERKGRQEDGQGGLGLSIGSTGQIANPFGNLNISNNNSSAASSRLTFSKSIDSLIPGKLNSSGMIGPEKNMQVSSAAPQGTTVSPWVKSPVASTLRTTPITSSSKDTSKLSSNLELKNIYAGKYYRIKGEDDVFDRDTGKLVSFNEANQKNIWKYIEEIDPKDTSKTQEWTRSLNQKTADETYKQARLAGKNENDAFLEARNMAGVEPNRDKIETWIRNNPDYNPDFGINTLAGNDEATNKEIYDQLNPSQQSFYGASFEGASILNGVDTTQGKAKFVFDTLRDKKKLAAMLDLTEAEAAALPEGMLSVQLNQLRQSVRNEHKLDEQRNNLTQLQSRGYTIENDLKSYIRGKDEYLGNIDKLIQQANDLAATMDMSDPNVAARMKNYSNYLTILQGRQNQRYIDFLNTGISYHNAEIQRTQDQYNKSIEQANEQYQAQAAETTESYQMMVSMLEGIYDSAEKLEAEQEKRYYYEQEQLNASWDNAYKAIRNASGLQEIIGSAASGVDVSDPQAVINALNSNPWVTKTETQEISAATAGMYRDYYSSGTNDDGTTNFKVFNPVQVRYNAQLGGNSTGDYAVDSFLSDVGSTVKKQVANGDFSSVNTFKNEVNSLLSDATGLQKEGQTDAANAIASDAAELESQIRTNIQNGLYDYFSSSEERNKSLLDAIKELSNLEGKWMGISFGYSRDKFMNEYGDQLGSTLAGHIYDMTDATYKFSKEADPKFQSKDIFADINGENAKSWMAGALAGYIITR